MATRRRNGDAVTTTPDRHGHLRHPLGLLECGVGGLWLCLWYVIVECVVVSFIGCVCCHGMHSVMGYVCSCTKLLSEHLCNKCRVHFDNKVLRWTAPM